jgi:hypothetical protein
MRVHRLDHALAIPKSDNCFGQNADGSPFTRKGQIPIVKQLVYHFATDPQVTCGFRHRHEFCRIELIVMTHEKHPLVVDGETCPSRYKLQMIIRRRLGMASNQQISSLSSGQKGMVPSVSVHVPQ